jgi:tetratricopeptide (TPR) repeat protein
MCRWMALLVLAAAVSACARTYERGDALYRQGDLRGALDAWNRISEKDPDYSEARGRIDRARDELQRSFRLYEKRGRFYEDEGRLAEALLNYRLALKLDPSRTALMDRVQGLVRDLFERRRTQRERLSAALQGGELLQASRLADELEKLDPFDPAIQIEIRGVRTRFGNELRRHLEAGRALYAQGASARATQEFNQALALDDDNEEALGYLSYIRSVGSAESAPAALAASTPPQPRPPRSETPRAPTGSAPRPPAAARPDEVTQEDILAEGHFRSATQAEQEGDVYWAIQQYEAALRVNSRHPTARKRLADLRRRLTPQIETLDEEGKRYFREEDVQNALVMWRRVLLIDPSREKTSRNVEDAEKILSRLEEIQSGG